MPKPKKLSPGRLPPGTGLPRQRKGPFGIAPRAQGGLGAMSPDPSMPPPSARSLNMGDPMGTLPRPVVAPGGIPTRATGMGQAKGKSKPKAKKKY